MTISHVLLKALDSQLRVARRLKARADAAAVAAEECEKALLEIRRLIVDARSIVAPSGSSELADIEVAPPKPDYSALRLLARVSPIDSVVWTTKGNRRAAVIINATTSVELGKRLDALLQILYEQPDVDGFAGFIGYDALRKEISRREGRRVSRHALSQSLALLANEFEAHGLNKFWVDRDPLRRKVRLLIRRPPSAVPEAADDATTSHVTDGRTSLTKLSNRPTRVATAQRLGRQRLL